MLSKTELENYRTIQYHKAPNLIEWFSRKGAIALDGKVNGRAFRLAATHLAGEEGAYFTAKVQFARNAQLHQLATAFLNSTASQVPVIIAGGICHAALRRW